MYSFKFIFDLPFTDTTRIIEINHFTLNEARQKFRNNLRKESPKLLDLLEPIELIEPSITQLQIHNE